MEESVEVLPCGIGMHPGIRDRVGHAIARLTQSLARLKSRENPDNIWDAKKDQVHARKLMLRRIDTCVQGPDIVMRHHPASGVALL